MKPILMQILNLKSHNFINNYIQNNLQKSLCSQLQVYGGASINRDQLMLRIRRTNNPNHLTEGLY